MSPRTENLKLIISGDGKLLGAELGNSEKQVKRYESRIAGIFSNISKKIGSSIKNVVTNPLAMIGGAGAIIYAGKQIMDYDASLSRLAIKSGMTAKEQMKLREEIDNVAMATGQSHGDILSGLSKMKDETGSIAMARDMMQDMAIAAGATGASMEEIGNLSAQLNDKLGLNKDQIKESLNLMAAQGKMQGFSVEDLAKNGERIFAAASRFSMSGMGDMRSFTAFLSTAKESVGSETRAVMAIESILTKVGDLKGAFGFNFKDDKGNLKSIETIIKGIITATGGNQAKIDKLFGGRGTKALAEMVKEYKKTGGFATTFDAFKNADVGKQGQMMQDFSRYTETAQYQMKMLGNAAWSFADAGLSPIIKQLAGGLKELTSDPAKMAEFKRTLQEISVVAGDFAAAIGLAAKGFMSVYKFSKSAGVGLYLLQNPQARKAVEAGKESLFRDFNSLPLEERSKRIAELNKTGSASAAPIVQNTINIKTQKDPGVVTVDSSDSGSPVKVNNDRGSLE